MLIIIQIDNVLVHGEFIVEDLLDPLSFKNPKILHVTLSQFESVNFVSEIASIKAAQ